MFQSTTAQVWAQRLDRFDRAEMTVAQFCLQEGVSQASLYQWRRKLRSGDSSNKNGQRTNSQRTNGQRTNGQRTNGQRTNGQRTNGQRKSPPSFLPVSLPTPSTNTPALPPTPPALPALPSTNARSTPPTLMTVELPSGIRIQLEFPTDHQQAIPREAHS